MALTRDMLAGARRGEWERVAEIQDQRFGLIRRYFGAAREAADLDAIKPQVSALLEMDAEVASRGEHARQQIAQGLQQLQQGKAARKAYGC
jgi:hypothetical protein